MRRADPTSMLNVFSALRQVVNGAAPRPIFAAMTGDDLLFVASMAVSMLALGTLDTIASDEASLEQTVRADDEASGRAWCETN